MNRYFMVSPSVATVAVMAFTMASTAYASVGPLPQPEDGFYSCGGRARSIARSRADTCYPDLNLHSFRSLRPDAAHVFVCYRHCYEPDRLRPANHHASGRDYRSRQAAKQKRARLAELLHREALHDAPGRRHDVVSRWQADRVHLQHQRAQQSVAGACERRMADAVDHQRSAAGAAGVVAGWNVDRLYLGPRWRRAVGRVSGLAQDRRGGEPAGLAGERRRRADV